MKVSAAGVNFDMKGNGLPVDIQWVGEGTNDGFLARDINNNGIIDDGGELFGIGTDILGENNTALGKASNGYIALDQFNSTFLGGNGDKKINRKDAVWNSLRIWVDVNADGISEPDEVKTLSEMGIKSIKTKYKITDRVDSSGNLIPYWSWVKLVDTDDPGRLRMVDIFFQVL